MPTPGASSTATSSRGNIMLGKYGETLVVDWGLAKVIGDREGRSQSEEGIVRPFSGSSTSPTQMGHVMGTPAYMSPEQAGGRLDALGPASDVYSLGATLYQLLTGREPIQGSHVGEILAKVKHGDWLPPRKVRTSLPTALDAICRKAARSSRRRDTRRPRRWRRTSNTGWPMSRWRRTVNRGGEGCGAGCGGTEGWQRVRRGS